ncbi:MAG: hypothetical protein ACK4OM_05730 [Alphaproteobacteria bacterium]
MKIRRNILLLIILLNIPIAFSSEDKLNFSDIKYTGSPIQTLSNKVNISTFIGNPFNRYSGGSSMWTFQRKLRSKDFVWFRHTTNGLFCVLLIWIILFYRFWR